MHKRLRVLIADDHEQCRWVIAKLLKTSFAIAGAVDNGRELVQAAVSLLPDVIVSDISMPLMTGTQAMTELRCRGHAIPFVLVSSDVSGAEQYVSEGAMGFVAKVDMGRELATAVTSVYSGECYVSRSAATAVPPEQKAFSN
jgi:DNA-binding NarL/FixJ family response regulator